jgi:UDP-N-acetylmuramoyl-tripeptide--D-alanyl-D-alanine ligase
VELYAWQAAVLAVVGVCTSLRQLLGWLYLFQLDEYLPSRLWPTARRRLREKLPWQLALALGGIALALAGAVLTRRVLLPALILAAVLPLGLYRPFATRSRLTWTRRARRLALSAAGLTLVALFFAFWAGPEGALAMGLVDLVLVAALSLATALLSPYEAGQRRRYIGMARARLRASGPLVIGITGSYGKTTTKVLLQQLLDSADSPCFATPESFNTTLGVCRAINEGLAPEHRVAVVEMGAYRPGEIAEICSFTEPRVAILTAIGLMHLERFGTRRRIAEAKSELLAAVPEGGFAVMPSAIAEKDVLLSHLRARLVQVGTDQDRFWVEDEEVTAEGTSFRLRGSSGEDLSLVTPLYGRHLLSDLLCALAVAIELGQPLAELKQKVGRLRGAAHRLEVTRNAGITIIDDAYNSNPDGAAEALRLLGALPGVRRVLVTPGYIELGPEQEQNMIDLGEMAADVCTHVILVGPRRSAPIRMGLDRRGFPGHQVSVVADLAEAQKILPSVAGVGSVVLFENDLPDQYLEGS